MKLVKMSIAAVVTALLAGCSGSMVVPVQEHASILSNADQAKQARIKRLAAQRARAPARDGSGARCCDAMAASASAE